MALIKFQARCNGCRAKAGKRHKLFCDHAFCAEHGVQLIQCERECRKPNRHTGYWAGELEAVEFGWFVHSAPRLTPCGPEHPNAGPDLNAVLDRCVWDPATERFVLPATE